MSSAEKSPADGVVKLAGRYPFAAFLLVLLWGLYSLLDKHPEFRALLIENIKTSFTLLPSGWMMLLMIFTWLVIGYLIIEVRHWREACNLCETDRKADNERARKGLERSKRTVERMFERLWAEKHGQAYEEPPDEDEGDDLALDVYPMTERRSRDVPVRHNRRRRTL